MLFLSSSFGETQGLTIGYKLTISGLTIEKDYCMLVVFAIISRL